MQFKYDGTFYISPYYINFKEVYNGTFWYFIYETLTHILPVFSRY